MNKVIDIEERIPSMREKRRRKTNKKFLLVLSSVRYCAPRDILFPITVK